MPGGGVRMLPACARSAHGWRPQSGSSRIRLSARSATIWPTGHVSLLRLRRSAIQTSSCNMQLASSCTLQPGLISLVDLQRHVYHCQQPNSRRHPYQEIGVLCRWPDCKQQAMRRCPRRRLLRRQPMQMPRSSGPGLRSRHSSCGCECTATLTAALIHKLYPRALASKTPKFCQQQNRRCLEVEGCLADMPALWRLCPFKLHCSIGLCLPFAQRGKFAPAGRQNELNSSPSQEREEQLAAREQASAEQGQEAAQVAARAQAQRLEVDRAARALQAERAELQVSTIVAALTALLVLVSVLGLQFDD